MKRTNKIILVYIFFLFCFLVKNINAVYMEDIALSSIDGKPEDYYTSRVNSSMYNIYDANSKKYYALFIESENFINEIQLDTLIISNSSDAILYKAVFSNYNKSIMINNVSIEKSYYTFEIAISFDYSSISDRNIIIRINSENPFQFNMNVLSEQIIPEETKPFTMSVFEVFGLIAFPLLILTSLYRKIQLPVIHTQKEGTYEFVKVGRFTDETEFDKDLSLNKLYFHDTGGNIKIVYSNLSWKQLIQYDLQETANSTLKAVLSFHHVFPHIIYKKFKLSADLNKKEKIAIDSKKNKSLKVLMFVLSFFGFNRWVIKTYKMLDFEEKDVTEIDFMELEYSMDRLEYQFDVSYQKNDINTETGKQVIEQVTEKSITYNRILQIEKSNHSNLSISFSGVKTKTYSNLKEAISDKKTIDEITSYYEQLTLKSSKEIRKLNEDRAKISEELRELSDNMKIKIIEAVNKSNQKSDALFMNIPDIINRILYYEKLGTGIEDSIKKAFKEMLEEQEKEVKKKDRILQLETEITKKDEILKALQEKNKSYLITGGSNE